MHRNKNHRRIQLVQNKCISAEHAIFSKTEDKVKADRMIADRGKLAMIVSDNGTEFTSNAMLRWSRRPGSLGT